MINRIIWPFLEERAKTSSPSAKDTFNTANTAELTRCCCHYLPSTEWRISLGEFHLEIVAEMGISSIL